MADDPETPTVVIARDLPDVPGFVISRRVGEGGMAEVYLARDEQLGRQVALKMIGTSAGAPDEFRERFADEARVVAAFSHPNIVTVYSFGAVGGRQYIAMEYAGGGSLADRLRGGPLDEREALQIGIKLALALSYSHKHAVVHRDVKPANVLFNEEGEPVLSDFGIAKALNDGSGRTTPGMVVGSLDYMAPEQLAGDPPVSEKTDIYSLGLVLFEMLTGSRPRRELKAVKTGEAAAKKFAEALGPGRARYAPVIVRCLMLDPQMRPTGAELAEALHAFEPSRRRGVALTALAGVLVLAAVLGIGSRVWNPFADPLVTFVVKPADAEPFLYVNGVQRRTRDVTLAPGAHEVAVVYPGYFGQLVDFRVTESAAIYIELTPLGAPTFEEFRLVTELLGGSTLDEVREANVSYPLYADLLALREAQLSGESAVVGGFRRRFATLAALGDAASQLALYLAADDALFQFGADEQLRWLRDASDSGYALATFYLAAHREFDAVADEVLTDAEALELRALYAAAASQGLDFAETFVQRVDDSLEPGGS